MGDPARFDVRPLIELGAHLRAMTPAGGGSVSTAEIPAELLAAAVDAIGAIEDLRELGDFFVATAALGQLLYQARTGMDSDGYLAELLAAGMTAPLAGGGAQR